MRLRSSSVRARRLTITGASAVVVASTLTLAGPAGASARPSVTGTYKCVASAFGQSTTYTGTITVSGTTPISAKPGSAVSMSGVQSSVTIPAAAVNEILQYASSISGKVTTFDIKATDAKTATVNAAKSAWKIPSTQLVANSPLSLTLPAAPIKVRSWTASSPGTMTFSTGPVKLTITVNVTGITIDVPVTCTPKPAAVLSTTSVS